MRGNRLYTVLQLSSLPSLILFHGYFYPHFPSLSTQIFSNLPHSYQQDVVFFLILDISVCFLFWSYLLSSYNLSFDKLNTNHNPVINQG